MMKIIRIIDKVFINNYSLEYYNGKCRENEDRIDALLNNGCSTYENALQLSESVDQALWSYGHHFAKK